MHEYAENHRSIAVACSTHTFYKVKTHFFPLVKPIEQFTLFEILPYILVWIII